jgi:hypothetical protein
MQRGYSMHRRRQFGGAVLGVATLALLLGGASPARAEFVHFRWVNDPPTQTTLPDVLSLDFSGVTNTPGSFAAGTTLTELAFSLTGPDFPAPTTFVGPLAVSNSGPLTYDLAAGDVTGGTLTFSVLTNGQSVPIVMEPAPISPDTVTPDGVTIEYLVLGTFLGLGFQPLTSGHIDATGVPEPASLTLLGIGALGLLGYGWRKRKQAA